MADSSDYPRSTPSRLPLDQAEIAAESALVPAEVTHCAACGAPLTEVFYEVSGRIVCTLCHDKIEGFLQGGSRVARALKGLVFGMIGGAIGAAIYFAISRLTGWDIELLIVAVALLVGGAVRAGSENRGGRFYQLLAVFLTYSTIVAMFALPALLTYLRQGPEEGVRISAIPVQIAEREPISVPIFCIALWAGWRINRKVPHPLHGPYRLSTGKTDIAPREEAPHEP
jgi:hypothetical protein